MKMMLLLALAAAPALAPAMAEAPGQRHGGQRSAFEARRQGKALSLREIEARVIPTMKGSQYIGFDYDPGSAIYTLKFLRDGTVIWVDVDGRSGQIVGRTGR
jgi:hypothetical protein